MLKNNKAIKWLSKLPDSRKILLFSLMVIILVVFLLWDKIQVEQCERLMTNRGLEIIESISKLDTSREKVIGKKVYFCIKKLYGIDPSDVQFTRPFPK